MNIIELHVRYGGRPIFVNVEKIIDFHGNHTIGEDWQFSVINLDKGTIEVKETSEEIILAIIKAKAEGKPVLSEETINRYRSVAPHSLW